MSYPPLPFSSNSVPTPLSLVAGCVLHFRSVSGALRMRFENIKG